MIWLRPGSQVLELLQLLTVAGEFSYKSLTLLGSEQVWQKKVFELTTTQEFRSEDNKRDYKAKLLLVSGKKDNKTIRLCCRAKNGAFEVMPELHPEAVNWYHRLFPTAFSGDLRNLERNHRVAEVLALIMTAGIEMRPYILPELSRLGLDEYGSPTIPRLTGYYSARYLKQLGIEKFHLTQGELDAGASHKNQFSRFVGTLFYPDGAYIAYNTRNTVMKWSGAGEHKTYLDLSGLIKVNTGREYQKSAILFGDNISKAMETVEGTYNPKSPEFALSELYHSLHFVPLNQEGIRLLNLLILPDWDEKLLSALFDSEDRSQDVSHIEYDAYSDGIYSYSFVDCDLARFQKFKSAIKDETAKFRVVCLPWQEAYVRETLKDRVSLKVVTMDAIEKEVKIK